MKYIIIILLPFIVGCKCFRCDEPELKPLPPEKLYDLLHIGNNYAYKSITIEDIIVKDEC